MFCTKCGAEIPEGAKFCIMCGASSDGDAPAQPTAPAQPAAPAQPETPVTKSQFFWKKGPKSTKIINIVSLAVGLLCLLLVILSAGKLLNGPILDLPIMRISGAIEGADVDEFEDQLDDLVDLLKDAEDDEDIIYEIEDRFDLDLIYLEEEYDITIKDLIDLFDPLSFTSLIKLTSFIDGYDEETIMIFNIILIAVRVITVVLAILAALAVIFRKTWIAIVAYIFSFGFIAFAGGFIFWLLATVAYIASAILYSKLNGSYKTYIRSFGA